MFKNANQLISNSIRKKNKTKWTHPPFGVYTLGLCLGMTDLMYVTIQYFDPWKLRYLQTTPLKIYQTNKQKQKLCLLCQCHMLELILVKHSSPLRALAGVPVLLFRCPLWPGKRGPLRSVGPWGEGGKEERVWKDILNALLSWRITLLHVAFHYLCKMRALCPQTDEDQCGPRVTSCRRASMKSPECLSFLSKPNGSFFIIGLFFLIKNL